MDPKQVVIVDDEMVLGHLMQAAFATLSDGIDVKVVASAEEAAAEIAGKKLNLLVCDVKLPGVSGLDFTAEVKKRHPHARVIIVSGLNDPKLKEKAISVGADAFFPKPVEMRHFLETASTLLGTLPRHTGKLPVVDLIETHTDLLVDILISLRQELGALCVALVDDRSKIVANAGELPDDDFNSRVIPYLVSFTGSVERLNSAMQPDEPENILSFKGKQYNLMVALLDPGHLLIVVLKHGKGTARLAIAYDAISQTVTEIQHKLKDIALPSLENGQSEEEIIREAQKEDTAHPSEHPEKADADFADLFTPVSGKKGKANDADNFWEDATSKPTASDAKGADLLSFDEASKLGYAPGPEDNKE